MITDAIPNYADLGYDVSSAQQSTWDAERARRRRYLRYYSGAIFKDKVPLDAGTDEDAPLLYPVGINLVKMLCIAQAEALWGEWEDDIVRWKVSQDSEESKSAEAAIKLAQGILTSNNFASTAYELGLDRETYGGCAIKVGPDLNNPPFYIRLNRIDLDGFLPVWDPENIDELLECYLYTVLTREQAMAKYGLKTDKEKILRVEKWTRTQYKTTIDGKRVDAYSGQNPYKVVPIVYVPRMRSESWWGDALTEDLINVQDEMNARVADMGESINYNCHPIKWGRNLPTTFNSAEYPLDPGELWDLGRTIGNSPPPEVGLLEAKNAVPQGAFEYVKFLYDWTRTSTFTPPIAFGEDQGGGQRSGRTLEIRMWPLLRSSRRSRAYMAAGLRQMMKIAAKILLQKKISDISMHAANRFLENDVVPSFSPLMPKDQAAIVDQIVKLMMTPTPVLSLATAHKWLGLGPGEEDRVREMITDPDYQDLFQGKQQGTAEGETT